MKEITNLKLGGTIFSGIAGEYFVAAELSRRGYIASLTLRNTPDVDILASNGERTVKIQVKTRRTDKTNGWNFGGKELIHKKEWSNMFYVLVEISSDPIAGAVGYYIIPKNELNEIVEKNFREWLKGTNLRNGQPRKSKVRMFIPRELSDFPVQEYKDRWDKLFETD
ncbi:MAG: hypothetical protein A3G11_01245 [Candidatus Lloydbacteria bacterium RIFCSPLOWO2_12_FULL_51_9]|uniref:Aspartate ammonia-lyase n=1 Tax=Candidatus Lloydbacteria bacterium RIFCSPLOWO2_12_FULL_51_9 TaxID=1798669 RepID=A0A1G2DS73_9BACT|nr:MAG: hypothetical protein A3G11_01245 [Candidatus Lloydbacteria bacterium RIFCSPLOWO2_12_FULL_51_9]